MGHENAAGMAHVGVRLTAQLGLGLKEHSLRLRIKAFSQTL
jgi:hypothetical protein